MKTRTRRTLIAASLAYAVAVIYTLTRLPLSPLFNALLASLVVPLVWLIWALARASAYQHANRWARDIEKVHAGRPRPLPHQEVAR